jgi:hypothetical protein
MKRRVSFALLVMAIACGALSLAACGAKDAEVPTSNIDVAKDAAAKVNILAVKSGIQAYIAANDQLPPAVTQDVLGGLVSPWPTNPWTQAPMGPGEANGDYTYTPGSGLTYTLTVHLSDGSSVPAP